MKKVTFLIAMFTILLSVGCSSIQSCDTDNELICDLYETGVNEINTCRMVFEGSEANFGRIRVEVDTDTISEVWSMLQFSESGGKHFACGWVTIEFFSSSDRMNPNASLRIMCGGDDSGIYAMETKRVIYDEDKGCFVGLYKCAGLGEYVLEFLKEEFNRQNKN